MTMEKTAKRPKAPKTGKASKKNVEPVKPKGFSVPGQKRFSTVKDALRDTAETLGILHVQTHDRLKHR